MAHSKSFTYILAGLGLTAGLFLGCQDLTSQGSAGSTAVTDPAAQDVSLRLAIKDSGACLDMKDKIVAAHLNGTELKDVDSEFVSGCITEVKGADTAKALPPMMVPDDKTRCMWIQTQIDVGRDEMTVKFRHYCPDECDTSVKGDSLVHAKYCNEPGKGGHDSDVVAPPGHDSDATGPKHDSDAARRDCDTLKMEMDATTPGTQIHKDQEAAFKLKCGEPKPDTMPEPKPKPDSIPPKTDCDSLRMQIAKMDTTTDAFAKLSRQLMESCPMPKPLPLPAFPPK